MTENFSHFLPEREEVSASDGKKNRLGEACPSHPTGFYAPYTIREQK